ncbi:MAG: lysozyme [Alphaproteobacteria bacterium]|nr:lysozyme [Alphaproteobacteria bacterium]
MKISEKGILEIITHEGIVLSPYKDCVGIWTVGIGHTKSLRKGPQFFVRKALSSREVMALFLKDIAPCLERVRTIFNRDITQEQFDAAVSFDFNTGALLRASWVRHFNNGHDDKAKKAFMAWCKPSQIIERRRKEKKLFFEQKYSSSGYVVLYPASCTGDVLWGQGQRVSYSDFFVKPGGRDANSGLSSGRFTSRKETDRKETTRKTAPMGIKEEVFDEQLSPDPAMVPSFRPQQDQEITRAVLEKFSYLTPVDYQNDLIKVLMVRGYYMNIMGNKGQNERAVYDDALFVVSPEGTQSFNGNADPSIFRRGIATIKDPQAIQYSPGLHGYNRRAGPYPAFCQEAPCTVMRDGRGEDTGLFFVNLHRGGVEDTSSKGCLTVPPNQWKEFYALLCGLLEKYGQSTFFLTLLSYPEDEPPVILSSGGAAYRES